MEVLQKFKKWTELVEILLGSFKLLQTQLDNKLDLIGHFFHAYNPNIDLLFFIKLY